MKVLTLHQPYAVAAVTCSPTTGKAIKQWETRTGPPSGPMCPPGVKAIPGHRIEPGERILIHAAAKPVGKEWDGPRGMVGELGDMWVFHREIHRHPALVNGSTIVPIEYGAVVGSVTVTGAMLIRGCWEDDDDDIDRPTVWIEGPTRRPVGQTVVDGLVHQDVGGVETSIDDQIGWGDWQSGRWAIQLSDPVPCNPIATKGSQGVWAISSPYIIQTTGVTL